jgi:Glycosyltransferase like family
VIAFGCPILSEETYHQRAAPAIERLREPDTLVIEKRGYDSIQQPFNEILDEASQAADLEAVVLLHEDTEIRAGNLFEVIRWHLRDPRIGVIGAVGGAGVRDSVWWSYKLFGWCLIPRISPLLYFHTTGAHEVDVIDGYLMIVTAPAARRVRFDERHKEYFHGYDVDFCFRARARGFKVIVDDIDTRHWSVGGPSVDPRFGPSYAAFNRSWDPSRWPPEWRGSAPYGFVR